MGVPADEIFLVHDHVCECCGKEKKEVFCSRHYFPTVDGYDYMSFYECKECGGDPNGEK